MAGRAAGLSVLLLVIAVSALSCGGDIGSPNWLDAEHVRVQAVSVPAGAKLLQASGVVRETWESRASWDVETDLTWPAYVDFLKQNLQTFHTRGSASSRISFARWLGNDQEVLEVLVIAEGPPLRVRLTLAGFPS